ncbi:MAG: bifunctional phosphopantothenoylcysteine decarboxylase/phosphopantothenate--cysteine ligase CoaBC [Bacteroidales bacterium]|nr:bifunctional phosphopantothenoylcysteine decarboxylase/phosphopantothenate--cysteine ligase CoaBC [Bacteroidales bacterium]
MMMKGKKIVIGVTGSIAAYKIASLVRLLIREGAEVQVIMTPMATSFITPLTLSTLSQRPVIIEPFQEANGQWNSHVEIGLWADVMLFAPVTANTLGKMVNGIADNSVITTYLSAKCPVFIAPAMDLDMFRHPSTQRNIEFLKSFGNIIIEPQVGELASGLSGPGRMEDPERMVEILSTHFKSSTAFSKKKILITAGPTYEKIDPVRFIGNFSTGKMGFSLAEQAALQGAEVYLVTGPTSLQLQHPSIHRIDVLSAEEMYQSCMNLAHDMNVIIMAAAVSDYTPQKQYQNKIKKTQHSLTLSLSPTNDILSELGTRKSKNQLLIGFALETDDEITNARKKLELKNLDAIILNSLNDQGAGFGATTNKISIIDRKGKIHHRPLMDKREVAIDILDFVKKIEL